VKYSVIQKIMELLRKRFTVDTYIMYMKKPKSSSVSCESTLMLDGKPNQVRHHVGKI
jgi:hypothetical protein